MKDFNDWWKEVFNEAEENCENRCDIWDLESWCREAFERGQMAGEDNG
jgi:hypothetical protein